MGNFIEGWKIELLDVNDAIGVAPQYVKNPDTFVQLNNMKVSIQSAISAAQTAITDEGYPANPIFNRSAWTVAACMAARQGIRWMKAAHGMNYTQLHMTHKNGVGGGGILPSVTVNLGGNLLDRLIAGFDDFISPWYDDWFVATGFNELGFPILGGTAGSNSPYTPFIGVMENLQFGVSALLGDTRDIVSIVGQYAKNPDTAKQLQAIQNVHYVNMNAALRQVFLNESYIDSTSNYDLNTYNSSCAAAGRIAYRWFERGRNNLKQVVDMFDASTLPTLPNSTYLVDGAKWPSILDHVRSFDLFMYIGQPAIGLTPVANAFLAQVGCGIP